MLWNEVSLGLERQLGEVAAAEVQVPGDWRGLAGAVVSTGGVWRWGCDVQMTCAPASGAAREV